MYHYLFTNDLRITNLQSMLQLTGEAFVNDSVPSAQENKSLNNNMNSLGFYFNLTRDSNCAKLCSNGDLDLVILNFIKKFQFPNPRTNTSLQEAVADNITIAPLRIIIQVLHYLNTMQPLAAYLSRDEIRELIFYNSIAAKTDRPDLVKIVNQIIEYRKTGILPETVETNPGKRNWNHEDRQIREMTEILTWSGYITEDDDHKLFISYEKLSVKEKAALFDILSCSSIWKPSTTNFNEAKEDYIEYMDIPDEELEYDSNYPDDEISEGKNIILYGVPGCGKSHTIKRDYCNDEDLMERIVFHPDYTYSDFIGQILPDVYKDEEEVEHISYNFIPGPFTRIMKKACDPRNANNHYYLVIEEINRGNAPAIFGDVFQLLDRKNGISEYAINNEAVANEVYGNPEEPIRIPNNLTILATMNTADQNVFTLDTAFKRRWQLKNIPNDIQHCDFKTTTIKGTDVTWESFVNTINKTIIESEEIAYGSADKRIGAYFVNKKELQDNNMFSEKVLMYLWNDVFKYDPGKVFKSEYRTLEDLIQGFENVGFDIFTDNVIFEHIDNGIDSSEYDEP